MSKKKTKCVICDTELKIKGTENQIKCPQCKATYDPEIFQKQEKTKNKKIRLKRVRILVAIVATFYLLFIQARIILY